MENLLLYIVEVIVAHPECSIKRIVGGLNGAQWLICLGDSCLFILDEKDLNMLYYYIQNNPYSVDDTARNRFSHLFSCTLYTLK